ncbi:hypothetical protein DK27_14560 [Xanthomonas arboricola pv. pruni]|nr:hypothetical protein DK27_14560 [Xanthomonas arboricola pv. pruni]
MLVVGAARAVENSTDSAKRTAATPCGRAYPPRFALRPVAYRRRPAPSAGHPYGVPPAAPAPPPVKWLAFGQDALPGRGQGRAVQLNRRRRAGRYAPRQEPATQAERPQSAFRKRAGRGRRATERAPERAGRP